jgi:hypothetical protein
MLLSQQLCIELSLMTACHTSLNHDTSHFPKTLLSKTSQNQLK